MSELVADVRAFVRETQTQIGEGANDAILIVLARPLLR